VAIGPEFDRYLEVKYIERLVDWAKWPGNMFTDRDIPVRYCNHDDFGYTEQGNDIYAAWGDITILCPDSPFEEIQFFGDLGAMESNRLIF